MGFKREEEEMVKMGFFFHEGKPRKGLIAGEGSGGQGRVFKDGKYGTRSVC